MAQRDLSGGGGQPLRAIQDVATELGITTRTIRFYEDKGLLEPQRVGTMRVYSRREVGRLQLILRGKRLGFSLRQIKEFLDLYDVDSRHLEQTRRLLARVSERVEALEAQREALDQTLGELRGIASACRERIAEAS
ncbi:MerR family transcriptional regulator [Rhizorhabdus argentea]|uniref:MerR family transcriptional regulator n=1 Tax=Rhizorhabdus argentea TaxID=1387174 RepID=UPI0030ED3B1D